MDVAEIIIFAQQLCFAAARFRRPTTTLLHLYNYIYLNVHTLLLLCPRVVFSDIYYYIPLVHIIGDEQHISPKNQKRFNVILSSYV